MPELAEVFYYAKQWAAGEGKPVQRVELHARSRVFRGCDTGALEEGMVGSSLKSALTHGKQMLFKFTRGHWLGIHLGMTGEISVERQPYEAEKHDHLVLHLRERALVFTDPRQFGLVQYFEGTQPPPFWQALPPQVMSDEFTLPLVTGVLERHARVPLKMLLLDQRYFPGVGNWMADEIMWQMKLPPAIPAGSLNARQARALHKTVRHVTQGALETVGENWSDPPQDWLFRYRWEDGHVCPRCEAELVRESLRGRTACWCPVCQK
jgi:formamidopyrimidine-DNA glycosylase